MSAAGTADWIAFAVIVAVLLAIDIGYASGGAALRSRRKAWAWSAGWIAISLAFGASIWLRLGREAGLDYLTAYFLEKSLSVDNLVVFALVFSQTGIPPALQRRVLFWGSSAPSSCGRSSSAPASTSSSASSGSSIRSPPYCSTARLACCAVGCASGVGSRQPARSARAGWAASSPSPRSCTASVSRCAATGRRYATPLLVALVAIESADLVFAIDSIPAVLAVTRDPFLVYTSNVFALLGLRSLYAVIGDVLDRFAYLRMALAALLVFVAGKLALSPFLHIPSGASLLVIAAVFALAAAAQRLLPRPGRKQRIATNSADRH